jgi:probable HAF family extracellular repeat protein
MVDLGDLEGGILASSAADVSADGSVVVGQGSSKAGPEAFRWSQADGMVGLGDLRGGEFQSAARAVSADGAVVVGVGRRAAGAEAFRWSRARGLVGLGDLPGGAVDSEALDVSADGSIVVGRAHDESGARAFIWDSANGLRSIEELLVARHGLDLAGWTLLEATAVSDDGQTIAGVGLDPDGRREAWRAVLPRAGSGRPRPRRRPARNRGPAGRPDGVTNPRRIREGGRGGAADFTSARTLRALRTGFA